MPRPKLKVKHRGIVTFEICEEIEEYFTEYEDGRILSSGHTYESWEDFKDSNHLIIKARITYPPKNKKKGKNNDNSKQTPI